MKPFLHVSISSNEPNLLGIAHAKIAKAFKPEFLIVEHINPDEHFVEPDEKSLYDTIKQTNPRLFLTTVTIETDQVEPTESEPTDQRLFKTLCRELKELNKVMQANVVSQELEEVTTIQAVSQ